MSEKKTIIIALNLDLLHRAFFCLGELGRWIGAYFLGRIDKNHDSPEVIMFSKMFRAFSVF